MTRAPSIRRIRRTAARSVKRKFSPRPFQQITPGTDAAAPGVFVFGKRKRLRMFSNYALVWRPSVVRFNSDNSPWIIRMTQYAGSLTY